MTALWHGYKLENENLPAPRCIVNSDALARKDCNTGVKAAEYEDYPAVLERKAEVLISMWTAAERPLVYTGAGISTSAGIQDYASKASGSTVQPAARRLTHDFIQSLQPTVAHRILTEMEKQGLIWGWLQQNHDGLAQKAGFPTMKVNEIHGSWLDSVHNPIIAMSGTLRDDLVEWMFEMEKQCDFVFACGTSFSGLNADRCADTCASRHMKKGRGQGIAVVSVQNTTKDDVCALRVYSKIDHFMMILARKLGTIKMPLPSTVHKYEAPNRPTKPLAPAVWTLERQQKRAVYEGLWGMNTDDAPTKNAEPVAANRSNTTQITKCSVKAPDAAAENQIVQIGNTHRLIQSSENKNTHGWKMRVVTRSIRMIRSVTFFLHPTFSPSEVIVDCPQQIDGMEVFELPERRGWGTFQVKVDICTQDDRTLSYMHDLSFEGDGSFHDHIIA